MTNKPEVTMRSAGILIVAIICVAGGATVAEVTPPNIVLILTDDQGWSQVSQAMDPRIPESRSTYLETPSMSRLAREGMRFTSGYSPAPLCTPTRRSILCGTSAARSGTEFKSEWIPAEHMTIPKALKNANRDYRCAHFGKWGENMISTPERCGYDTSIRPLLSDPEASIQRPENSLFFHRPQRKFSAIRQDSYKLMLFWASDGTIRSRELYHFNPDPREQGRNIVEKETDRANDLQAILLAYLKAVGAEKAANVRPKRKNKEKRE